MGVGNSHNRHFNKGFIVVLLGFYADKIHLVQMKILKGSFVTNSMYYFCLSLWNE